MRKRFFRILAALMGIIGLSTCVIACYGPPPIDLDEESENEEMVLSDVDYPQADDIFADYPE